LYVITIAPFYFRTSTLRNKINTVEEEEFVISLSKNNDKNEAIKEQLIEILSERNNHLVFMDQNSCNEEKYLVRKNTPLIKQAIK